MTSHAIRICHVVSSRASRAIARHTSYVVVPDSWKGLPIEAIWQRSEVMLEASYKQRAEMALIAFDVEWVDAAEMPALPAQRDARVMANPELAPQLIDRAVLELDLLRGVDRPGVRAKAWQGAFAAWTVSPEGDSWYLLGTPEERDHEFEARFSAAEHLRAPSSASATTTDACARCDPRARRAATRSRCRPSRRTLPLPFDQPSST